MLFRSLYVWRHRAARHKVLFNGIRVGEVTDLGLAPEAVRPDQPHSIFLRGALGGLRQRPRSMTKARADNQSASITGSPLTWRCNMMFAASAIVRPADAFDVDLVAVADRQQLRRQRRKRVGSWVQGFSRVGVRSHVRRPSPAYPRRNCDR